MIKSSWAIICKVGNFSALLQRGFLFTSLFPAIAIVMVPIKMFWQWYCQTGIRAPEIATHFLILLHFYSWAADFAFRVHSGKPQSHYFYEILMQGLEIGHFCCDGQPRRRHYLNPSIWFYASLANLSDLEKKIIERNFKKKNIVKRMPGIFYTTIFWRFYVVTE